MANEQTPTKEQRVVRVFISSTFRDMHAEREELVKFTFPELKKRCRERQVEFVEVDLRWGVTDEQRAEGQVLPICLEEIQRCRPYFIGLLGERYGWVPDSLPQELIDQQNWLEEHREHSVTELEILHGVIRNPEMAEYAFFYFRDPKASAKVEEELRKLPSYEPEPEASRPKLQILKDKIREHCKEHSPGKLRENYPDAKTLGQLILDDLWKVIDERFPITEIPTALERERNEHQAFGSARTRVYIGRQELFDRLDEHVASDGPPLVILGEPGSGKSALLANWSEQYRKNHPEDFVVRHYIGSTADSADYVRLLRRIIEEIKERYEPQQAVSSIQSALGEEGGIPTDPKKAVEEFPLWVARAAAKGRFVLVIDALNQLDDRDNAHDLRWMPWSFSPHVRVIFSDLPGRTLEAIRKRNWSELNLQPMAKDEQRQYIRQYLDQYRKSLSPTQIERIIAEEATASPLYLRTLLEELRIFGIHEELERRIEHYLTATTVEGLFNLVLERLEQDYDRERPGLVRDVTTLIWASRRGLSESELLEILQEEGSPILRAQWSALYLAFEESVLNRGGLLNFFHDFLTKAVGAKYLPAKELQQNAHIRIAGYFAKRTLDDRKADELPFQLRETENWTALMECVTDIEMFLLLSMENKQYELIGYWLAIGDRSDMAQAYTEMIAQLERTSGDPIDLADKSLKTAGFLHINAKFDAAEPLLRRSLAICEQALDADHPNTAMSLNELATLLKAKGDYEGAKPLYHRSLAICEQALGADHPDTATSLNNLAMLLKAKGDYEGAEPLLRRSLAICEQVLGAGHPQTATSLNNLAMLLEAKGDYQGAEPLLRRSLAIREQVLGADHPNTAASLNGLATLLEAKGDYQGVEPLLRQSLAIREQVLGADHPDTAGSLSNLAALLKAKGEYEGAEPLYRRSLAIREQVLGTEHPDTAGSLHNLAMLLEAKGDYQGAEPLLRRSLAIREQVLGADHPDTAAIVNDLAALFYAKGDYEGAEPLLRRSLATKEQVLGADHPDTATSLNNLATLLYAKGDYQGAEPLYRRSLAIREQVLGADHPDTATSLNNLAMLLKAKSDYEGAEELLRRSLATKEQVFGAEHPDTAGSLNNLAMLLYAKGDYEGAEPLLRRSLAIYEQVLGADHPQTATSFNNLAMLLEGEGDYEKAEPLYRRSLAIREQALGTEHPDTAGSLHNLAMLLHTQGDYEGAEPLYRRSLAISEQVLGADHPQTTVTLGRLADLLEKTGRNDEARALRLKRIEAQSSNPRLPSLSLRQMALDCFRLGDYDQAVTLLKRVLEQGFEVPSTHIHLARIAFLTNTDDEVRDNVEQAWEHRSEAPRYVVARILWMRLALAFMDQQRIEKSGAATQEKDRATVSVLIGQLKTVLADEGSAMEWAMDLVLDHLKPRVSGDAHEFLAALVAALSSRDKIPDLDRFPLWRDQAPVSLDVPWPE